MHHVPTLSNQSFQCPERKCLAGGSRVRNLVDKSQKICIHTSLVLKSGQSSEKGKKSDKKVNYEFDRAQTVDAVTELILEHIPSATSDPRTFLKLNKDFVAKLCNKNDLSGELFKHCKSDCPRCSDKLSRYTHKTKESFLLSLGDIKKVTIPVKHCDKCNILVYPYLYQFGLIPLHNKECVRFTTFVFGKFFITIFFKLYNFPY